MKSIILCMAGTILLSAAKGQDVNEQLAASLGTLRAAVEAHPDSLSVHERYIEAFRKSIPNYSYRIKDSVLALLEPQYKIWMERFPRSATVAFAMGGAYADAENSKARPFLLKAVELDPHMAMAWADLSQDADRWGDARASRDYLKKAMDADPSNPNYAYYYGSSLESTDPQRAKQIELDVVKRFPQSERGAQVLYWMASHSTDDRAKGSLFEELRSKYPPGKFHWSASGMGLYFDYLLVKDPVKALALARSMAGSGLDDYDKKEWDKRTPMAEKVAAAYKALDQHRPAEALALLSVVKVKYWSGAVEPLNLLRARAMDASGNTAGAYDSLLVYYAKQPSEDTHAAMLKYAAKMGKDAAWVDAGINQRRESTAERAPDFKLYAYLTGDSVSLADYRGKVVLLTFWFPGCGPCRDEFPHFQAMLDKFRGEDIAYLGIDVDLSQDEYVLPFMKSSGFTFRPLRDNKEGSVKKPYKVRGEPTNFLIDGQGRIIFSDFSVHDEHEQRMLETMIGSMLARKTSASAEEGNFMIRGKIAGHSEQAMAYLLYQVSLGGAAILDSAVVKNGNFAFKGSVPRPLMASMYVNRKGTGFSDTSLKKIKLFLVPGTISVTVFSGAFDDASVAGGQINADYNTIKMLTDPIEQRRVALSDEYHVAPREKRPDLQNLYDSLEAPLRKIYLDFIRANPDHLMSLLALKMYGSYIPKVNEVEPLFDSLSTDVRESKMGMEYAAEIRKLKAVGVGATAPDFTQPDTLGKAVSLHDFKGKYVMVDFWASWCVPCREENPDIVKAYQKYKDKGFHILSISLDGHSTKDAWPKAIHDDHLDWTQVCDFTGMYKNEVAKLYSVVAIPQNFLIGPDGKIIAEDLHGADLDKTLKEIFK